MDILNITPIDGRYRKKTLVLNNFFSEYGFIKYRLRIEIEYFLFLQKILGFILSENEIDNINDIFNNFTPQNCLSVKKIEESCSHDVKALEYYIR